MDNEEIMTAPDTEDNSVDDGYEPQAENIPEELGGLSPESVKELMKEVEPESEEDFEDERSRGSFAEPTSVKKEEETFKKPGQKIPYERFKEVVDKNNNMKEEVEQLRAELAKMKNQQPQQQYEDYERPQPQPQSQPTFNVTPEMSKEISDTIRQQALSMSGLTEDDYESLDYMDDDDERKQRWEQAHKIAETTVYNHIANARAEQARNAQRFIEMHQKAIAGYNEFTQAQQAEPDFEQIRDYANLEYFNGLPEDEKPVIAEAYVRCQRQTASPQDMAVIKRYFLDAKNAYRKSHGGKPKTTAKNIESKYAQSKAFPRASQVSGSAGSSGAPSVEALERMLTEVPWDEIPQEYKELVMNAGLG